MLTRLASHYPNSGHTPKTLKIVAEDWWHTFKGKATDRAFVEAVTIARRKGGAFFPTESDIFKILGIDPDIDCKKCSYYNDGKCRNILDQSFNEMSCRSFIEVKSNQ